MFDEMYLKLKLFDFGKASFGFNKCFLFSLLSDSVTPIIMYSIALFLRRGF